MNKGNGKFGGPWARIFPFLLWFRDYDGQRVRADFLAGLTVAMVLIPQSMAYAQLAGLPAYYGLYASFLPPMVASLFGSSRQLATGPVTIVSLMTATALEPLATAGSSSFIAYAVMLALLVGLFQFSLGILRLGLVVNFLSYPVVSGFINAAAIICIISQLPKLFGLMVEKGDHGYETLYNIFTAIPHHTHWPTLGLALLAMALMLVLKRLNPRIPHVLVAVIITTLIAWGIGYENKKQAPLSQVADLEVRARILEFNSNLAKFGKAQEKRIQVMERARDAEGIHGAHSAEAMEFNHQAALLGIEIEEEKEKISRFRNLLRNIPFDCVVEDEGRYRFFPKGSVPAVMTAQGDTYRIDVGSTTLHEGGIVFSSGGAVVGTVPSGFPAFGLPALHFSILLDLLPIAAVIALLGFMQSISSAKAMAARTGQRLNPNQELIGQGLANMAGSLSQSYPVSGSFSRSALNLQAGAVTGMSSVFTSSMVVVAFLFLTPLLYHLPQSVLAAIIIVAVCSLIQVKGLIYAWHAQRYDGFIGAITFLSTLALAPHLEFGVLIGIALSLGVYLVRTMRPNMALLSLYMDGTYRDSNRFGLGQCRHIAVIRFDGSLFFENVNYLEDKILELVSDMPELKHIILVGKGINRLDASGEEMLYSLVCRLREAGYELSLTSLNDSVKEVMRRTHLYETIGKDHIYRNMAMAMDAIHEKAHIDSEERACPLLMVLFKGLPVSAKTKRRPLILEGDAAQKPPEP